MVFYTVLTMLASPSYGKNTEIQVLWLMHIDVRRVIILSELEKIYLTLQNTYDAENICKVVAVQDTKKVS